MSVLSTSTTTKLRGSGVRVEQTLKALEKAGSDSVVLADCCLSIKDVRILAQHIRKNKKLTSLDLRGNQLRGDAVVLIANASENYRMPYANNLKKNQKKKVNSIIKNQVHNQKKYKHSNINDTSTQSPSIEREKQRHLKKISKVAEKKRKEKRKKQRKKLIDRIKNRNRLNHPSSHACKALSFAFKCNSFLFNFAWICHTAFGIAVIIDGLGIVLALIGLGTVDAYVAILFFLTWCFGKLNVGKEGEAFIAKNAFNDTDPFRDLLLPRPYEEG